MADRIVVLWRDIPAQVIIKQGRKTAKRELPLRFAEAIDMAAMRAKLTGTDAYLEEWRRSVPTACGDDLEAEAQRAHDELDSAYPQERVRELVKNLGVEPGPD